jgi:hypothetical protein
MRSATIKIFQLAKLILKHFSRTENFPKISLLNVENFQLQIFLFPTGKFSLVETALPEWKLMDLSPDES